MTDKEAIEILTSAPKWDKKSSEALSVAINALGAISQIQWERDTAIEQLKELGYSFGEKPRTDGDLVSRQAAIEALGEEPYGDTDYDLGLRNQWKWDVEAIKALSSAKSKTGRWISLDDFRGKYNEYGYKCSECGEQCDYKENYCPNCGCKMEVGHDK